MPRGNSRELAVKDAATAHVPTIVRHAGRKASKRFLEFFAANIRNKNTRVAYYRATLDFFAWCEDQSLALIDIEPIAVAAYVEYLGEIYSKPSVKQHLAAIRMCFDWLVVGQIVPMNPASSVRGPTHVVKRGKTPVLTSKDARKLLDSIDTSTLIGLRDRAIISVMIYSFARISAVVGMRVEDYYQSGKRSWFRLHEKGGKFHEVPVHHNAEIYLDEYLEAAGIATETRSPLFRSAPGHGTTLSQLSLSRQDAWRMVKRRARNAGISDKTCNHTFRATGITTYLEGGGTVEKAQAIAGHESPRTTKLYDRTDDQITLDEIERITI